MPTDPGPVPLENDPRNPCIGCGPENPIGLRLRFARQGDVVSTSLRADRLHEGWPGRLHSGVLYLALVETANWTAFSIRGRVGLPVQTSALRTDRLVRTGEELTLTGRATAAKGEELEVGVDARDERDHPVGHIARTYAFPDRAEFLRRLGYEVAPPELDELLPG